MAGKRGRKGLSKDDRAVWDKVTQSVTPLQRTGDALPLPAPSEKPKPVAAPSPKPDKAAPLTGLGTRRRSDPPTSFDPAPSLEERLAQAPLRMDRKAYHKLKRGKTAPEARIDLHGMTQAEAHPALVRFILQSQTRGLRTVLVITGKGRRGEDWGPIPDRPGILRHQVPHWLSIGAMRQVVLQVTEAHLRHGGSGAYYVHLRRRR